MQLASGWRLREHTLELLPAGSNPLRILHLSDLHVAPGQTEKIEWVRSLAELNPDLVVNTGDNLGHRDAIEPALSALEPLLSFAGVFVWGSNDYFAPRKSNPLRYLWRDTSGTAAARESLQTELFGAALTAAGWLDLNNQSAELELRGSKLGFLGLNDPHENLADFDSLDTQAQQLKGPDVVLGVAHAPYLRVIEELTLRAAELVLCGHTHGGQVCLPGGRAIVTNCDLPPKFAKGLSAWQFGERRSILNVSAGVGTSVYAQYRVFCPPEASLLTLIARR